MKKKKRFFRSLWLAVVFSLVSWLTLPAQAQAPAAAGRQRPQPPIFTALDASQDGVIDMTELANASLALKELDKNGDGKLSADEYRPPRPDRPSPRADEQDGESLERAGRVDRKKNEQTSDGQAKPQDSARRRPRPPVDLALDENGDETISAGEMGNATALLKKLDANGDGKLSRDECLPKLDLNSEGHGESSSTRRHSDREVDPAHSQKNEP